MEKFVTYNGNQIFYRVKGNGKPVILIHGFGEDGDIFHHQVEYLKDKFRLIVPDLPGSGKSDMTDDMSIEGMSDVIYTIIQEENIETCPVIGHSMGGYITLALMEKHWNHISGFGLFHSSAFADSEEKKIGRKKSIEFIKKNGAYEFLKTAIPNLFSDQSKIVFNDFINELIQKGNNFLPQSLVSYYDAMIQRADRTKTLIQSTVPVLFILGKYDEAIPLNDGLKQSHLPKKSYIHILQNSGHMGMIEEKQSCNLFLEKFLLEI